MKALVTGGAGFIGSNLIRLLTDNGHRVTVLDDLSSGHRPNLDPFPEVGFVNGDVRDAAVVREAMDGAEAVFHLAASVGNTRSIEQPITDSEINVIGTLRVLEEARRRGIRKVVFSSSAGIFGELKTLPIAEDHPTEPDSPYGASKLAAEKLCLAYSKLHGMRCVCLRYFNVFGVNQRYDAYGNVIPIFVHRLLRGLTLTIFGDGEQTRDFADARDVAAANIAAAQAEDTWGAFNIGSGERITINRLVELLGEVSGIVPKVEHGPPRKGDVRHSLADIAAAHRELGYLPSVDFQQGLFEYVEWARRQMRTS